MQAQDAPSLMLFKLWPKIEENKNLIFAAAGVILVGTLIFSYISWHGEQQEVSAGQDITKVMISQDGVATAQAFADKLLAVANQHPGTAAAVRAHLQAATALFGGGQYAAAQTEFQKLLDSNPESFFKSSATLGLAACLEAQGKTPDAVQAYKQVETFSESESALAAKFALGRLSEAAGKDTEAESYYGQVAGNSDLGNEAALRKLALEARHAPSKPAAAGMPAISIQPAPTAATPVKP